MTEPKRVIAYTISVAPLKKNGKAVESKRRWLCWEDEGKAIVWEKDPDEATLWEEREDVIAMKELTLQAIAEAKKHKRPFGGAMCQLDIETVAMEFTGATEADPLGFVVMLTATEGDDSSTMITACLQRNAENLKWITSLGEATFFKTQEKADAMLEQAAVMIREDPGRLGKLAGKQLEFFAIPIFDIDIA